VPAAADGGREIGGYDVAVIGAGIVGASAAAFLVEAGMEVVLFERDHVAAGASGRNSGVVQQPFDPALAELHHETLATYRRLTEDGTGFDIGSSPKGLLLLSADAAVASRAAADIERSAPALRPVVVDADGLRELEPTLAPGLVACRLETGYPVDPGGATRAFAWLAERRGVRLRIGEEAVPAIDKGRVKGVVLPSGEIVSSAKVLVAAGPRTPELIPGWREDPPIRPIWGVVVSTSLPSPPEHVLEELGIDRSGPQPEALFSLVRVGESLSVGSTFAAQRPNPSRSVGPILERARRFLPALTGAAVDGVRMCARPAAVDGRPFIGNVMGVEGLFVCAGHGPWGISTGPASARLVTDVMLGNGHERAEFAPSRLITDAGVTG
jgi:glycine/D-amino acid oxidase-like deaminating enzyme